MANPTSKTPAVKFTDCLGREWKIKLTVGMVRKIVQAGKPDLNKVQASDKDLSELVWFNPIGVAEILWLMVEDQAAAQGISQEQFEEGFDSDGNQAAGIALFETIILFFRPAEMAKELMKLHPKMAAKMAESVKKAAEQALALDTPPSITPSPNGNAPAGNEPASSGLIRGPSHFES